MARPGLSLASDGAFRYRLKTPYREGTSPCAASSATHMIFQPLDFLLRLTSLV
jgi:hypothetical protein